MLTTIECWALSSSAASSPWTLSRGAKNVRWSSGYPSRKRPSALYLARSSHTSGASAIGTPLLPVSVVTGGGRYVHPVAPPASIRDLRPPSPGGRVRERSHHVSKAISACCSLTLSSADEHAQTSASERGNRHPLGPRGPRRRRSSTPGCPSWTPSHPPP